MILSNAFESAGPQMNTSLDKSSGTPLNKQKNQHSDNSTFVQLKLSTETDYFPRESYIIELAFNFTKHLHHTVQPIRWNRDMFEINCAYCNETMTNVMTRAVELTTWRRTLVGKMGNGHSLDVWRDLVLLNCLKWRFQGTCATFRVCMQPNGNLTTLVWSVPDSCATWI